MLDSMKLFTITFAILLTMAWTANAQVPALAYNFMASTFFFDGNHFELLIGVSYPREMILSGASAAEIKARWAQDAAEFKIRRRPYLLYKE